MAIFDVDGFIQEQPPTYLMASDIEWVAILVRNGTISRYGPAGAGGVIIINYFGNQTELPTYLKVTMYFDYARSSQDEKMKVFKLSERNTKTQLFKVDTKLKLFPIKPVKPPN